MGRVRAQVRCEGRRKADRERAGPQPGVSNASFFAKLEAFHYEPPGLGFVLGARGVELAALTLWFLLGGAALAAAASGLRARSVA